MNGYKFADAFVSAFCNLARFLGEAFDALADDLDEWREMYTKSNSELLEALAAIFDENDKEEIMKNYKICEITGMEVGEVFSVCKADGTTYDATITELGLIEFAGKHELIDIINLYDIINGKATIKRKPQFGEHELNTLRLLYSNGVRWIAANGMLGYTFLLGFSGNVKRRGGGWDGEDLVKISPDYLFPQITRYDNPIDIEAVLLAAGMLEGGDEDL